MDVSELNDNDLRTLLSIFQEDHPEALTAAIETMNASDEIPFDDLTFTEQEKDGKENLDVNAKFEQLKEKKGCYLHYDPSSAKLKLQYTSTPVPNAIGFYSSPTIPEFKYKKNFGRSDLIGNCASGVAGRKQYYSGWCQFIRAARAALSSEENASGDTGEFWIFPRDQDSQGLDVDIYVYDALAEYQTVQLPESMPLKDKILNADAVTCLPRHSSVFEEVKKMDLNRWLVRANNIGSTSRFTVAAGPDRAVSPALISLVPEGRSSSGGVVEENNNLGEIEAPPHEEEKGCYLLYDADSCKLKLQYSTTRVRDAIGFYCAGTGHTIRGFKFTKNFGRSELIGNCASGVTGRKNYYSGWCQFLRAARALNGPVWIYPRTESQPGLDVDIYVYYKEPNDQNELALDGQNSNKLEDGVLCNISNIDGVACLPKHADFFTEVKTMDMNRWMTEGNIIGATSRFE